MQILNTVAHHTTTHRSGSNSRALLEVVTAYMLLEGALWTKGAAQLAWALLTLTWVGFCTWRSQRQPDELGIGKSGFLRSLWLVPLAALVCAGMLTVAYFSGSLHDLRGARAPFWHALLYLVWAFVQEYITMSFIFVRLEDRLGARMAILTTATLFCLAHVPNLILMVVTFILALLFCWFFYRFRNIYPVAIAHGLLGLTLSVTFSSAITHNMKVGIAYFT